MGYNKIIANGKTVLDLTEDTVTADTLAQGLSAHDAAGNKIIGTAFGATLSAEETEDGVTLTATDKNGTTSAAVKNGKSAYAYAQDGGYTGTEEEFTQKLAGESAGTVEVDATLTQEGKAADAKAVGDALANKAKHPLHLDVSGFTMPLTVYAISETTGKTYTLEEIYEESKTRQITLKTRLTAGGGVKVGFFRYSTYSIFNGTLNYVEFVGHYTDESGKWIPAIARIETINSVPKVTITDAEWAGGSSDGTSGGTSELLNEHGFLKKEVLPPGYGYVEVNSETVIYIYASELTVDENGFYNYSRRIPALRVGETYTVSYNGANYTCTAVGGSVIGETDDDIVLGNYGLVLGEEGTGEPFVLSVSGYRRYLSSGISAAIIPLDGEELSSDILISGLTITPYPSHPDYTGTSPLVVTCRHVDGFANRLETDTDFSIILTAIKAGRIVVCISDGRVFGLKAYDDISIEFDCIRIQSNAVASVKISNATLTITNGIGYASYTANTYTVPFTE